MGGLEQSSLAASPRPGKGAVRIAEQFGLQQVPVECRAVDSDEGAVPSWTGVVDALGEHLLACAGLSIEHDRELGIRKVFGQPLGIPDRRRAAQDVRKTVFRHQPLLVELDTDVPLGCLQSLDVLKCGHHTFDLSAHPDGHPVGRDQSPVDVHHLADLRLPRMEDVSHMGVG